jgi:DNA-binding response OmpR family regulator
MSSFRILIVDDLYPMARALSYLFTKEGFSCRTAGDGLEALEKMAEEKPDLVILDIQMPRMDGLEACRRIRADNALKDVHVIVATALGEDEDVGRAMEAGADECIQKPVDPPQFLERVKEIARETLGPCRETADQAP